MSTTTPGAGAPGDPAAPFTITRQSHTPTFDEQGQESASWRIYFKTPSGVEAFIDVADSDYTVENVAALIREKVRTIEAVHQLS